MFLSILTLSLFACNKGVKVDMQNLVSGQEQKTLESKVETTPVRENNKESINKKSIDTDLDPFYSNSKTIGEYNYKIMAVESDNHEETIEYYRYRLALVGGSSFMDLLKKKHVNPEELTNYLFNENSINFQLQIGEFKIPCNSYVASSTGGIVGFIDLVLGFKVTSDKSSVRTIVYNDKLTGVGPVKMKIFSK